jgi:hypothetical protein
VLFVTAAQVLLDLRAQESARALERRLKYSLFDETGDADRMS